VQSELTKQSGDCTAGDLGVDLVIQNDQVF
jgi:hypothetical protein